MAHGLQMGAAQQGARSVGTDALRQSLARIWSDPRSNQVEYKVLAVMKAFKRHGARLDRKYTTGALKGLMVLARQGFVTEADFQGLLEGQVRKALIKKPLSVLRAATSGLLSRCQDYLR